MSWGRVKAHCKIVLMWLLVDCVSGRRRDTYILTRDSHLIYQEILRSLRTFKFGAIPGAVRLSFVSMLDYVCIHICKPQYL